MAIVLLLLVSLPFNRWLKRRYASTLSLADALSAENHALRSRIALYHTALEHIDDGVTLVDEDRQLLFYNQRILEFFDLPERLFEGDTRLADIVRYRAERGDYGRGFAAQADQHLSLARDPHPESPAFCEERVPGNGRVIESSVAVLANGTALATYRDISERKRIETELKRYQTNLEARVKERTLELLKANSRLKREIAERGQAETALRDNQARLTKIYEAINAGILVIDAEQLRIIESNPYASHLLGYPAGELRGLEFTELAAAAAIQQVMEALGRSQQNAAVHELGLRRKDGALIPVELSLSSLTLNERTLLLFVMRDISRRKRAELMYRRQATRDQLTDLPNRALLQQRLSQTIEDALQGDSLLALMFIDLDHFKHINDTFGHSSGDELLRQVSRRLRGCVRRSDLIARLGGDEFTIVMAGLRGASDAEMAARKILRALAEPFKLSKGEGSVTASVGITLCPSDGHSVEELLKHADTAMYQAKNRGRNAYCFYSAALNIKVLDRSRRERDLRQALLKRELNLYYQPIVELKNHQVVGAEVLLRWRHNNGHWISPAEFIPLAEETGLIVDIGEWVLRSACKRAKTWQTRGLPLQISVNFSARQCMQKSQRDLVASILTQTGLQAQALRLEITETAILGGINEVIDTLRTIRSHGVELVLDDFGTGYSSLSHLKRLPISSLKIDRSFVQDVTDNAESAALVEAILLMGYTLGLEVIAEGVETREQLDFLRAHGCRYAQGYYFAKPMPHPDFEAWTEHQNSRKIPKANTKAEVVRIPRLPKVH